VKVAKARTRGRAAAATEGSVAASDGLAHVPRVLALWRQAQGWPAGPWLFSWAVCRTAPYFGSISPRVVELTPGRCVARITDRRSVRNHLGTVHAIALCNLAELAAGVMIDASLPASMRWIPKGMTVEYLKKAIGTMHGVATPDIALVESPSGYELPVTVLVSNDAGEAVFRASIAMWVSPRR